MAAWQDSAACRGEDVDLFFPIGHGVEFAPQIKKAKRICARCPVGRECLDAAFDGPEKLRDLGRPHRGRAGADAPPDAAAGQRTPGEGSGAADRTGGGVSDLSVEQRDELAEALATDAVPWLTYAVHTHDANAVQSLLGELDWQALAALVVVLVSQRPRPVLPGDEIPRPGKAHPLITLLAAERVRQGITVPALARRLGYEAATVYGWEAGRKAPSLERLEDYANALGYQLTLQARQPPEVAPEEAADHRRAVAAACGFRDTTTTRREVA